MANNVAPILLGLGAAYLLMGKKKKGTSTNGGSGGGFGTAPVDGDTPCHVLNGVWAPATPGNQSPLAALTDKPELMFLPLTPEAYQEFETFFIEWVAANTAVAQADSETPIIFALQHVTKNMGCDWLNPGAWTGRMSQVFNAVEKMYDTNRLDYIEEKYKL